jgi:hypothetical protein
MEFVFVLNDAYEKYYNPSEHLAVDEIIVKFKRRVTFKHYIPKKQMFQNLQTL